MAFSRSAGYNNGRAVLRTKAIGRIFAIAMALVMVFAVVFSAVPFMLSQTQYTGNADSSSVLSFANNVIKTAKADDGSDFKGDNTPDGFSYDGCPGNDGKEDDNNKVDKKDNDARQICALKKSKVDKGNGAGKEAGDEKTNYNNVFGGTNSDGSDADADYGYGSTVDTSTATVDTSVWDTWNMVISRTLSSDYYINSDIPASDSKDGADREKVMLWQNKPTDACSHIDSPSKYDNDNCDIPGIITQAFQDISYNFMPSGIQNGGKKAAQTPFNIGIPTGLLPSDGDGKSIVPLQGSMGSNKYTALEAFGYNLSWTTYNGEWDKIDVPNSDRLAADMNIFTTVLSSVKLAFGNAVDAANKDVSNAWNSGNILALAGAILTWPFKVVKNTLTGSIYFFINGVMNSFENSIVQHKTWNRDDFWRDASYNVRMLSDTDKAGLSRYLIMYETRQMNYDSAADAGVDVGALDKQAAFPKSKPKKPEGVDNMSSEEKSAAYKKAWDDWIKDNKDKFDWGNKTLSLDPATYAPVSVSGNDSNNDGDTSSGSSDKRDPLDNAWETFREAWKTKASAWKDKEAQNQKQQIEGSLATLVESIWGAFTNIKKQADIQTKVHNDLASNAIYFFCVDDNGQAAKQPAGGKSGNDIIDKAIEQGFPWQGFAAFKTGTDKDGNPTADENKCAQGKMRQPIVGALNGQQGTLSQLNSHRDTRRVAYNNVSILSLMPNPAEAISSFMLGLSQKIAMGINFMVNLSFTPLLDQLGIKDVVVGIVNTLKDSFYMNCLQIIIVVGVMVAFLKGLRGRSFEAIKQVLLVCVSALLGLLLLYNPEASFKIVDEYPTMIEKSMAALILQSSVPNQDMCSATGAPTKKIDTTGYTDFNGNSTKFDPNATVRTIECNIWDAYVFEPWSLGQFGAGHAQLYAQGYAPSDGKATYGTMDTDDATKTLVGSAPVKLGGGVTVHNWALYQVSQMLSGTSTTTDTNQTLLKTDTDLYKIVDLQAGPDNATGKATKYWDTWIGGGNRFGVAGLALISSIGGLLSIGMFAFAKIEATFMMAVLFALAPVMLLIGIVPGGGRSKMQNWAFKILGLAFKRIVLVSLLSLQLVILIQAANSNTSDAMASMMFMAALSIIFAMYGKEIIKVFTEPIDKRAGAFNDIDERVREQMKNSSLGIAARGMKRGLVNSAGAFIGGAVAGGFRNRNSADNLFARYEEKQRNNITGKRDRTLNKANNMRKQAMDAYNNGTITLNEYNARQTEIAEMEHNANNAYSESMRDLAATQHKFDVDMNFRMQLMNSPELHEESDGVKQLKSTIGRAASEVHSQNRAAGNMFVIGDSIKAVQAEKDEQIQNAYNNIFVNNPEIGRALLDNGGKNSAKNAEALTAMLKGVDLRQVADQLNIAHDRNVQLTTEQMQEYGANYRFDEYGNGTLILPSNVQQGFRRTVLSQVSDETPNAGQVPDIDDGNNAHMSDADRLRQTFMSADKHAYNRELAIQAANKYVPENAQQLAEFKEAMNKHFNNPVDAKKIDAISPLIAGQDLHALSAHEADAQQVKDNDAVMRQITRETDAKVQAVKDDTSLTDHEKDERISAIRQEAGAERKKYGMTTNYAIGQSAVIAESMLSANVDTLKYQNIDIVKDIQFDDNGNIDIKWADGIHQQDKDAFVEDNQDMIDKIETIHQDIIAMDAYTGKQDSGFTYERDELGSTVKHVSADDHHGVVADPDKIHGNSKQTPQKLRQVKMDKNGKPVLDADGNAVLNKPHKTAYDQHGNIIYEENIRTSVSGINKELQDIKKNGTLDEKAAHAIGYDVDMTDNAIIDGTEAAFLAKNPHEAPMSSMISDFVSRNPAKGQMEISHGVTGKVLDDSDFIIGHTRTTGTATRNPGHKESMKHDPVKVHPVMPGVKPPAKPVSNANNGGTVKPSRPAPQPFSSTHGKQSSSGGSNHTPKANPSRQQQNKKGGRK